VTYIVTHTSPDWDAITSCWLLQRVGGFAGAEVRFVNTGAPDAETLAGAAAVVDTGREYDPDRHRYDHHQDAYADSATGRVALWVDAPSYLTPLIALVHHGDFGSPREGAKWSRTVGLHAALAGAKARKLDDAALLVYGYQLLDDIAALLRSRAEAAASIESCVTWKSADGLVWAIENGGPGATHAAGELGARLVIYRYIHPGEHCDDDLDIAPSSGFGCWRCGGVEVTTPHVGDLVAAALDISRDQEPPEVEYELSHWFRHPVGFFAGWGTDKAPRSEAPRVDAATIAALISDMWQRRAP
jgi:hypothetical protein